MFVLECGSVILLGAIRALGPNQRQSYVVLRLDTIASTKKNIRDLKEMELQYYLKNKVKSFVFQLTLSNIFNRPFRIKIPFSQLSNYQNKNKSNKVWLNIVYKSPYSHFPICFLFLSPLSSHCCSLPSSLSFFSWVYLCFFLNTSPFEMNGKINEIFFEVFTEKQGSSNGNVRRSSTPYLIEFIRNLKIKK